MTWGRQLKFLQEVREKTGILPPALRDRPALRDSHRHQLEAFYEISAGRVVGETVCPIPVSEILAYAQLMRIDNLADREWLFTCIRRLDAAFLEQVAKTTPSTST